MPDQSEGNNHTSKINIFPVLDTTFFSPEGQKMDLFAPQVPIKSTLWPLVEKINYIHRINKGRSRISMVWVSPLGFDPYCESKWLLLQDKFTPSINSKKKFVFKFWTNFGKSTNLIFSKTAKSVLMTKIYVIEGTKEVLKKIQEPILFIKRG